MKRLSGRYALKLSLFISLFLSSFLLNAQSPGVIVRLPSGITTSTTTVLNPDHNSYTSATNTGFTTHDVIQSEISYKKVPLPFSEPIGDLKTGEDGGFTDIVVSNNNTPLDDAGLYAYYDGTNIIFRMRVGGISNGSKGYSILIDNDLKIGNTGTNADPNYVAPTNIGNGNVGFEYEVLFKSGSGPATIVNNIDGKTAPTQVSSYSSNWQISMALSTQSGSPDYFYDFYVPVADLGLDQNSTFRIIATTVSSGTTAIQGSRSDIYGVDDRLYASTADAWAAVAKATPAFKLSNIGAGGSGLGGTCTAAPNLTSPIIAGTGVSVSGTWTRVDASKPNTATIKLYKDVNGTPTLIGSTTATSGATWTITGVNLSSGDVLYAKAVASGESECLQSNSVKVTGCSSQTLSSGLTISCSTERGIAGKRPAGAIVKMYSVTIGGISLFATDASITISNTLKITYPTDTTWEYQGTNTVSKDPCSGGTADITSGSYAFTIQSTGQCESDYVRTCVGLSQTADPTITPTVIYNGTTSFSGTAAANSLVRLFINGQLLTTTTATAGGAYTFSSLILNTGDIIGVSAQTTGWCVSNRITRTVTCFTNAPLINTDNFGNLAAGATTITGSSGEPAGTTIKVYNGSNTLLGTTTVSSTGAWSVAVTVVAGTSYYATAQNGTCDVSSFSATVSAIAATTVCPTITGSYNETSTTISGSLHSAFTGKVRLYLDGANIGSVDVNNSTTWSITFAANTLYPGGILTATTQAASAAEKTDCSGSVTISCVAPNAPTVIPSTLALSNSNGTINLTISNSQVDVLYTLEDLVGNDKSTSVFGTGASITLTSFTFFTPGTYNLKVNALKLSGSNCGNSSTTVTLTVSDNDGDGVADPVDIDDDNDGIVDTNETTVGDATGDADGDGILNYKDANFCTLSSDGICSNMDKDGDGVINQFDLDSDNDGIPDLVEAGGVDTNGDGRIDGVFADSDGDGLINTYDASSGGVNIANLDTDGDGIKNYIDLDSDNDGIADVAEVGGVDANGDGRLDNFNDSDGDGFDDTVDGDVGNDATIENTAKALLITGTDTDSDGKPNSYPQGVNNTDGRSLPNPYDLDSDNDGIADLTEAGGTDNDYNGKVDSFTDTDSDGFADARDGDVGNDGTAENTTNTLLSTGADANNDGKADSYSKANADGAGLPNMYDLDSDNDGVPDLIESGGLDSNGDGRIDALADVDNNGWQDSYDPTQSGGINIRTLDANGASTTGGSVFDFDGDGIANYLDLDADNDGVPDVIEQGGVDGNNDGKQDATTDTDNDGFVDSVDPINNTTGASLGTSIITTGSTLNTYSLPSTYSTGDNFDRTGLINMLDLDSDGDGILDTREAGLPDNNNDGVADGTLGTDGWSDAILTMNLPNTDGTASPNYLDIDSDDDGITDNIEGQSTTGYVKPLDTDADVDGIDDNYDNNDALFSGSANNGLTPYNYDGDATPDYIDLNSDNDNQADIIEGNDFNTNGTADDNVTLSGVDADGDGLDNIFEYSINDVNNGPIVTVIGFGQGTGGNSPAQKTLTTSTDRDWRNTNFYLAANITLPVKFVSLAANKQIDGVQIVWDVTSEENVKSYEVERSTDRSKFSKVGEVPFKASNSAINRYQLLDGTLLNNTIYYRIRQVDLDGKFTYSGIVSVRAVESDIKLTVHPNPVYNKASIVFSVIQNQKSELSVCDMQGNILIKRNIDLQKGQNLIHEDLFSQLAGGTYILMGKADGVLLKAMFVKQ